MKKILILAYDFPPYVSVGGLRPYSWYKFLNGFDIEPIVITRQWANEFGNHLDYVSKSKIQTTTYEKTELGTIIRTPYRPNFANRLLIKYGDYKFVFIRKAITGQPLLVYGDGEQTRAFSDIKYYMQPFDKLLTDYDGNL